MEGPSAPDGRRNLRLDFTVWLQTAVPIPRPPILWFIILALEMKGTVLFFLLRFSLDIKADETSQDAW